jgi:serine/threonine protein kinase
MVGATPASDIWSLAATICELISGHPPYHDLVALSAMFRIVEDEMPPLPESASPELQDFLKRCFSKLPQQRPTAAALFTHPWLLRNARDLRVRLSTTVCTQEVKGAASDFE